MVQSACRLRLVLEAAKPIGILRNVAGQDFDRDVALQPLVSRPVDLSHPARAQQGTGSRTDQAWYRQRASSEERAMHSSPRPDDTPIKRLAGARGFEAPTTLSRTGRRCHAKEPEWSAESGGRMLRNKFRKGVHRECTDGQTPEDRPS